MVVVIFEYESVMTQIFTTLFFVLKESKLRRNVESFVVILSTMQFVELTARRTSTHASCTTLPV